MVVYTHYITTVKVLLMKAQEVKWTNPKNKYWKLHELHKYAIKLMHTVWTKGQKIECFNEFLDVMVKDPICNGWVLQYIPVAAGTAFRVIRADEAS